MVDVLVKMQDDKHSTIMFQLLLIAYRYNIDWMDVSIKSILFFDHFELCVVAKRIGWLRLWSLWIPYTGINYRQFPKKVKWLCLILSANAAIRRNWQFNESIISDQQKYIISSILCIDLYLKFYLKGNEKYFSTFSIRN